jgi:TonB family protein
MRVRQYIIISFILHAVLITASFSIFYREREHPLPMDFMEVSFVEEFGLARFFPDILYPNSKNNPRSKNESRKQIARKSLFSSQSSTEYMVSDSQEDHGDNRQGLDFDVAVNLTEGISVFSNEDHESFQSKYIQQGGYHSSEFDGMRISQVTTPSSPNISQQDFRGNNSYRAIRALLEKAKNYPLLARKEGMEGMVQVSFTIDEKGLPQDIRILKSSGYRILDEEVKKMLKKASPFPGIMGEIVIPITFKFTDSISNR